MPSGCALILTSFISTTTSDSTGTEPRITTHVGGQYRRQVAGCASKIPLGLGVSPFLIRNYNDQSLHAPTT
jgi:hypothetical protein